MADDITEEEDLVLEAQDAGAMFRAEMWVTDTLLGYWPYLLATLGVGLGAIFFWSQYRDFQIDQQRGYAESVRRVETDLDGSVLDLGYMQASGQPLDEAGIRSAAEQLLTLDASGAGGTEARMKAAELFRLVGDTDQQRSALEFVAAQGIAPYAQLAEAALANLDLEAGDQEAAIARLEKLSTSGAEGYLREQALLDLGLVFEHLDRKDDARSTYDRFLETWPSSPRVEQVRQRRDGLAG